MSGLKRLKNWLYNSKEETGKNEEGVGSLKLRRNSKKSGY